MSMDSLASRSMQTLLAVAALGLLGLVLHRGYQVWEGPLDLGGPGPRAEAPEAARSAAGPVDYGMIANWRLFGEAPAANAAPVAPKVIDAPETRLRLVLLGVYFDTDTREGHAIIAEEGGAHFSYKIGDKVPKDGDATLFTVEKQRVILQRNGRPEALSMKLPELTDRPATPAAGRAPPPMPGAGGIRRPFRPNAMPTIPGR